MLNFVIEPARSVRALYRTNTKYMGTFPPLRILYFLPLISPCVGSTFSSPSVQQRFRQPRIYFLPLSCSVYLSLAVSTHDEHLKRAPKHRQKGSAAYSDRVQYYTALAKNIGDHVSFFLFYLAQCLCCQTYLIMVNIRKGHQNVGERVRQHTTIEFSNTRWWPKLLVAASVFFLFYLAQLICPQSRLI